MVQRRNYYSFFLFACLLLAPAFTQAQYATTGTGVLRGHIWWFNWGGFTPANGASRTFTTADGTVILIRFSNVTGSLVSDVMNTWSGAVLHNLYNFTDPNIQPALHSIQASTTVSFRMDITATRNGIPVPFTFVGADAEASEMNETTVFTTNGGPWTCLDLFSNAGQTINPVSGCNTQNIEIFETYAGAVGSGQNPLMATTSVSGNIQIDVSMERRQGLQGGMAVAFGIFSPYDRGDLPAGFGDAQHMLQFSYLDGCNFPTRPSVRQESLLYFGDVSGDADIVGGGDDNDNGADEDGIASFPEYNGSTGTYTVNIKVTNNTGADAYASAWFDYNRDGQFSVNEIQTATVSPGVRTVSFVWNNLPYELPAGTANDFAFRFRTASDLNEVSLPDGQAVNGEVEDYLQHIVQVCQLTKVNAGSDQTICATQTVQLTASGASTYTWNADPDLSAINIPNPRATLTAGREFIVSAIHANGCNSKDSIYVTVNPMPVYFASPLSASACAGESIDLQASGGDPGDIMEWMDGNGNLLGAGSSLSVTPPSNMVVRATFTNQRCNVRNMIDIPLTVNPLPVATITKSNDINCGYAVAQLTASGGVSYRWETGPGIGDQGAATQIVSPQGDFTYRVTVTGAHNCSSEAEISVLYNIYEGSALPQLPNAFTPNGDGRNDYFGVKRPGLISGFDFSIFDRWGNIVFRTNDVHTCWDGTFKGAPLPSSTFVYIITISSDCGPEKRKGTVTLIR